MRLPYFQNAIVAEAKITKYLLNETHEDGRNKAAFFVHFGFSVSEWDILAAALLQHAADNEVASVLDTPRGKHYAVEGNLQTPSERQALVRSVWAIETGSEIPRLITAYPLKAKRKDEND